MLGRDGDARVTNDRTIADALRAEAGINEIARDGVLTGELSPAGE